MTTNTWGINLVKAAHDHKIIEAHECVVTSYESPSHVELASVGGRISELVALITSLPERFFYSDLSSYAGEIGFTGCTWEAIKKFGELPTHNTFVRGDLTLKDDTWQLLELNVGNAIGGLFYASLPRLAGYQQQYDVLRDWAMQTTKHWKLGCTSAIVEDPKYIEYIKRLAPVMAKEISKYSEGDTYILGSDEIQFDGHILSCTNTGKKIDYLLPMFSEIHLTDNPADYYAMTRAIQCGKVQCVMGPISRLLANKGNLALLYELLDTRALKTHESKLVENFVPRTIWVLEENIDTLLKQKNEWVLKPITGFGGYGVVVGLEVTDDQWKIQLNHALMKRKSHVAQKYIHPIGRKTELTSKDGELEERISNIIWGIFVFGNEYLGTFIRANAVGESVIVNHINNAAIGPLPFDQEIMEGA